MVEQLANFGETTLAEALDASETGVDVADGSVFPSSGNFRVVVDDEVMLVTARTGNTLTVTRGAESSGAATHTDGTEIYMVLTAAGLDTAIDERIATHDAIVDAHHTRYTDAEAISAVGSHYTPDWGEVGDIDTLTFGQVAGAGSLAEEARADHAHGMPANPVTGHESTYDHTDLHTQAHTLQGGDHTWSGDLVPGTDAAHDVGSTSARVAEFVGVDARLRTVVTSTFPELILEAAETGPAVVQDGETLGRITFGGYDGTTWEPTAYIYAQAYGPVGSLPGRLTFATTNSGTPTDRMRIDEFGDVEILNGGLLYGPADPVSGTGVGDRDYNDGRYLLASAGEAHDRLHDHSNASDGTTLRPAQIGDTSTDVGNIYSDGTLFVSDLAGPYGVVNSQIGSITVGTVQTSSSGSLTLSSASPFMYFEAGGGTQSMTLSSSGDIDLFGQLGPEVTLSRNDSSILDTNILGRVVFGGKNTGGTYVESALIRAEARNTWGAAGNYGTRLTFYTTNTDEATPSARWHVADGGNLNPATASTYNIGDAQRVATVYADNLNSTGDITIGAQTITAAEWLDLTDSGETTLHTHGVGGHDLSSHTDMEVAANITFAADSSYDIGTDTVRPATVYADTVDAGTKVAATWIDSDGTDLRLDPGAANIQFDGHLLPDQNSTRDFGADEKRIKDVYISKTTGAGIYMGRDDSSFAILADENLATIYVQGRDTGGVFRTTAGIYVDANETWGNNANLGTRMEFWTTADGSATDAVRWIMADDGAFIPGADSSYDIGTDTVRVLYGYFDFLEAHSVWVTDGDMTSASTNGSELTLRRDDTSITSGSRLGGVVFQGRKTGGVYDDAAAIWAYGDADNDASYVPARLDFATVEDGVGLGVRWTIKNDGTFLPGADAAYSIGGDAVRPFGIWSYYFTSTNAGSGAYYRLERNDTSIVSGDGLGQVQWRGKGTNDTYYTTAAIEAEATETWGSTADHGTGLTFQTTVDGAGGKTDRWKIDGSGHFLPAADSSYDIGSDTVRPATVFADSVDIADDPADDGEVGNRGYNDDRYWPVGSVFISVVSTNPATLLGFGTWSAFGAGRVLVGLDSGDTDFDTVEETGGSKTHNHGTHTHGSHTHNLNGATAANASYANVRSDVAQVSVASATHNHGLPATLGPINFTATGNGNASSVQPYIVVYMWKRTA